MGRQRHKRKKHQMVILASDAVDAGMEQYRYRPWLIRIIVLVVCMGLGAGIGYIYYSGSVWMKQNVQYASLHEQIEVLEKEKAELESENAALNDTIQILSETINQKTEKETQLSAQLEKQYTPTEFPLTGSATMVEAEGEQPMCIFTGVEGAMVVATAGGTVTAVNDDTEYGHNVWVDHGNGYVTIYRNAGEIKVKKGETVTTGTTLFLVTEESNRLGYQMMKDGIYIHPMDMIAISG